MMQKLGPVANMLKRILRGARIVAGLCLVNVVFVSNIRSQEFSTAPQATQTVEIPAVRLNQLYERLDGAEQRIHQLESRRLPPIDAAAPVSTSSNIAAMEADLEARVKAIEKEQKKSADAALKKKSDDAKKPTQKWTGRVHTDYWGFPDTSPGANAFESANPNVANSGNPADAVDDRFLFRRLRFGVAGEIPDLMTYKIEMEWANPNSPTMKDAYLGWTDLPYLETVLLGNQKRPYGLDHLNSSRYNIFLERPFVVEALNQDARRFGLVSYGISDDLAYNWRWGGFLSTDMQGNGQYIATPDMQAEFAGRFANTIWYDEASDGRGYAHWAVSGSAGSSDPNGGSTTVARWQTRPEARTTNRWIDTGPVIGADNYQIAGVEGLANFGPVQVCGEFMNLSVQRNNASDLNFNGGYVYVSYFLTGEHMPWERESGTLGRIKPFQNFFSVRDCDGCHAIGWGAWQAAVRYSTADFSDDNVDGGVGNSVTFAMNWYWNPNARMQFNYIYGDIDNRRPAAGLTSGDYSIIGARFMVDF